MRNEELELARKDEEKVMEEHMKMKNNPNRIAAQLEKL